MTAVAVTRFSLSSEKEATPVGDASARLFRIAVSLNNGNSGSTYTSGAHVFTTKGTVDKYATSLRQLLNRINECLGVSSLRQSTIIQLYALLSGGRWCPVILSTQPPLRVVMNGLSHYPELQAAVLFVLNAASRERGTVVLGDITALKILLSGFAQSADIPFLSMVGDYCYQYLAERSLEIEEHDRHLVHADMTWCAYAKVIEYMFLEYRGCGQVNVRQAVYTFLQTRFHSFLFMAKNARANLAAKSVVAVAEDIPQSPAIPDSSTRVDEVDATEEE